MPMSTQCLYFHLNEGVDGFVNNPKRIQRMVGSLADDDLETDCKSFILTFEINYYCHQALENE